MELPVDKGDTLKVHSSIQKLEAEALDTVSALMECTETEARLVQKSVLAMASALDLSIPGIEHPEQAPTGPGDVRASSSDVTSPRTSTLAETCESTSGTACAPGMTATAIGMPSRKPRNDRIPASVSAAGSRRLWNR
jgi:hypothetical protein